LTDTSSRLDIPGNGSSLSVLDSLLPAAITGSTEIRLQQYTGARESDVEKMRWLGFFDDTPLFETSQEVSPAHILQTLLLQKLGMLPDDSDCVVMEHQLGYEFRDDHYEMTASMTLKGENERESALAKVTGF